MCPQHVYMGLLTPCFWLLLTAAVGLPLRKEGARGPGVGQERLQVLGCRRSCSISPVFRVAQEGEDLFSD